MTRLLALMLFFSGLSVLPAQNQVALFDKAPPGVEEALKARVTAFWDLQVARKSRQADQFVAEDAKDAYFEMEKPSCRSWAYQRARFEKGFTKAQVVVTCDTMMAFYGQTAWVNRPINSFWRLEDGKWWWMQPPAPKEFVTPFGVMKLQDPNAKVTPGPPPQASFKIPTSLEDMLSKLEVSRRKLQFKGAQASSEEVVITNRTGLSISLTAAPAQVEGFVILLDKTDLANGETAKATVKFAGGAIPAASSSRAVIRIEPLGQELVLDLQIEPDAAASSPIKVDRSPIVFPQLIRTDIAIGPCLRLLGMTPKATTVAPGGSLQFLVLWQFVSPLPADRSISYRIGNSAKPDLVVADTKGTADNRHPYAQIAPGDYVQDFVSLAIPATAAPGEYEVAVKVSPEGFYFVSQQRSKLWPDMLTLFSFKVGQ